MVYFSRQILLKVKTKSILMIESRFQYKNCIALYSGSFNPPTLSHRAIGTAVRDQIEPDEVWYMVSPQNPQKQAENMMAFSHRVAMSKLNVDGLPNLVVTDIEQEISQITRSTYSADTLRELFRRFPETHFFWVIGADCFVNFHTWKDFEFILSHLPLIVVPRKGWTEQIPRCPAFQHPCMRRLTYPTALRAAHGWFLLDVPEDGVSATEVRQQLSNRTQPKDIHPTVYNYILKHDLFQEKELL